MGSIDMIDMQVTRSPVHNYWERGCERQPDSLHKGALKTHNIQDDLH